MINTVNGETAFLKMQLIDIINILEMIYLKVIDWAKENLRWLLLGSLVRKPPLNMNSCNICSFMEANWLDIFSKKILWQTLIFITYMCPENHIRLIKILMNLQAYCFRKLFALEVITLNVLFKINRKIGNINKLLLSQSWNMWSNFRFDLAPVCKIWILA